MTDNNRSYRSTPSTIKCDPNEEQAVDKISTDTCKVGHVTDIRIYDPTPFRVKIIDGVTYDLDHLSSFDFSISTLGGYRRVYVEFSCHCFTEGLKDHHSPGLHYKHRNETRAFCVNRHHLSKELRGLVVGLGNKSVQNSNKGTFFILKDGLDGAGSSPYLVFFSTIRSKKSNVDVLINIESAYPKDNMTRRASPVRFTTLVEAVATGKRVRVGPEHVIKRK